MHIEKSYDLHHKQKGKYFLNKILDRTDNQDLIGEVKSLNLSKIKSVFDLDLDVIQRSLDHIVLSNNILRTAFIDVSGVTKQTVYKAYDVLSNELIYIDYFINHIRYR